MSITKKSRLAKSLQAHRERHAAERAQQAQSSGACPAIDSNPHRTTPTPPTPPTLNILPLGAPPTPPSLPLTANTSPPPATFVGLPALISDGLTPPSTPLFSKYDSPPIPLILEAIPLLEARVNPKRKSGYGHQQPNLTPLALKDLTSVLEFFRMYSDGDISWVQASIETSRLKGHGKGHAQSLRAWGRACLNDPAYIPRTAYGRSRQSLMDFDDFRVELEAYLHSVGKFVSIADVVRFTAQPNVQATWGLNQPISKTTARNWMRDLDYRWRRERKGLYLDGHEREDVVEYRQKEFLPKWREITARMQSFATFEPYTFMDPVIRQIVAWFHDECTFFANDQRLLIWVLMSASPTPVKKSEGQSLVVSDLISAKYGWLCSPDGLDCAREYFQAGKIGMITHAADILAKHYPSEDHVFIFDNSPTHKKRGSDAPSAQNMPEFTPKPGLKNFLVRTMDSDGNEIQVPMTGAYFSDGTPQSLYWPEGHPQAGRFKGMAAILKERGWENADRIRAKCAKKCEVGRKDCCLRRILFNEPDFSNPSSILERLVTSRGHGFLLLPKFHPELNPIEQAWGKAKRVFRQLPVPKGQAQLRRNVEAALRACVLEDHRKFCTRSERIADGYYKGLDPRWSIWAAKRFHGHRVYPEKILEEVEGLLRSEGNNGKRAKL